MIEVNVKHTLGRLETNLGLLGQERLNAAVRALNRTVTSGRAESARRLAPEFDGLKIAAIKKQLRFTRATRSSPSATLTFSNRRLSLFKNFAWRRTGKFGVRFSKLPWRIETGSGQPIPGTALAQAFVNRARGSGQASIFVRAGRDRYPIEVLLIPSMAAAFRERGIGDQASRFMLARFPVVFQQEAKFRLSQR